MNEWHAETEDGAKAVAHYHPESNEFEVIVIKGDIEKKARFPALYPPRFGIDICDAEVAMETSEALLKEIEG